MKKNILPLLLVICASNLWAQNPDTLVLRVNTLKKTGVILRQIIKGENKAATGVEYFFSYRVIYSIIISS